MAPTVSYLWPTKTELSRKVSENQRNSRAENIFVICPGSCHVTEIQKELFTSHFCDLYRSCAASREIISEAPFLISTPNMTGRRFHRTMDMILARPWKSKSPSASTLIKQCTNKGTQGVQARYDAELPPIISIVRYPGRPVISVPDDFLIF